MSVDSVRLGPIRVVLLSGEYRTARLIEELLHATRSRVHLVTHPTWDAAAAEALLDHPGCCVLLDLDSDAGAADHDERLARRAIGQGAQDCLIISELEPATLRRALNHAVERMRVEAQLSHQALHDQLTDLPNRALFLDRLGVALERSRRSGQPLAVLFLDFDNFKQINDTRGHGAADMLLATLGERLRGLLRPMDTIARFGGDEFTLLLEGITSEREVVLIADRICQAASLPTNLGGAEMTVTVSVGIAMVNDPTVAPETIIREADAAMYRAKERGRSRYPLAAPEARPDRSAGVHAAGQRHRAGAPDRAVRAPACPGGASASPLSKLRELPIDALKIDASFIAGLEASPEAASVLSALVELGHAMGLAVGAKGVETHAQLEQVRELGCDAAQGYAIGRPVSEEQLAARLVAEVA